MDGLLSRVKNIFTPKSATNNEPITQFIPEALGLSIKHCWHSLNSTSKLGASIICRDARRLFVPLIETALTFKLPKGKQPQTFSPRKIILSSSKIPDFLNFNSSVSPIITHLTFGQSFNQPLHVLPSSLLHLKFLSNFTHSLDGLPDGLTHLCAVHPGTTMYILENNQKNSDYILPFDSPSFPTFMYSHAENPSFLLNRHIRMQLIGYQLPLNHLPPSLTHLSISLFMDYQHSLDHLPPSLTHLNIDFCAERIGKYFNKSLDHLPPSLTHLFLQIPDYFNQPLHHLPSSITHLFVVNNRDLTSGWDYLPPSLSHFYLEYCVESLDYLPSSLSFLQIRTCFAAIDYLPSSLTTLHVGFAETIFFDNLPPSLTRLTVESPYILLDKIYFDHLPPSLSSLTIKMIDFDQPVDHLPPSLEELTITSHIVYTDKPVDYLPSSLRSLSIDGSLYHLPSSLTSLSVLRYDDHFYYFPPSLTTLKIGDVFQGSIPYLPEFITSLHLGIHYCLPLPPLPPSLLYLSFSPSSRFNLPLPNSLPPNLVSLSLPFAYTKPLPKNLPPSLSLLTIGPKYKISSIPATCHCIRIEEDSL